MIMPADPQRRRRLPAREHRRARLRGGRRSATVGQDRRRPARSGRRRDGRPRAPPGRAREEKTFAPGYGEFFTGGGGDVEALALAVPIDALAGPVPAALETLSARRRRELRGGPRRDWARGRARPERSTRRWQALRTGDVPPRLRERLSARARARWPRRCGPRAGAGRTGCARRDRRGTRPPTAPQAADRDRSRPLRALDAAATRRRGHAAGGGGRGRPRHARVDPGSLRAHARHGRPHARRRSRWSSCDPRWAQRICAARRLRRRGCESSSRAEPRLA